MNDQISEIQNKIRLLLINAMMEAARSGKAGKDFAVDVKEINELVEPDVEDTQNSTRS